MLESQRLKVVSKRAFLSFVTVNIERRGIRERETSVYLTQRKITKCKGKSTFLPSTAWLKRHSNHTPNLADLRWQFYMLLA